MHWVCGCIVLFSVWVIHQLDTRASFSQWKDGEYTQSMLVEDFSAIIAPENSKLANVKVEKGNLSLTQESKLVIALKPYLREVNLEYSVYFDALNTEVTLAGVAASSTNFSARVIATDKKLSVRVYHEDTSVADSLEIISDAILKPRGWNQIKLLVKMNTYNSYNGRLEVWANGEYVGEKNYIKFCASDCSIDTLILDSESRVKYKSVYLSP